MQIAKFKFIQVKISLNTQLGYLVNMEVNGKFVERRYILINVCS